MSGRRNILVTVGWVLSVSFVASALAVILVSRYYDKAQFDLLNAICAKMLKQAPETKQTLYAVLKGYTNGNADGTKMEDVLTSLGYHFYDFSASNHRAMLLFAVTGFFAGMVLFLFTFLYRNKIEAKRIQDLTEYLEQVNLGKAAVLTAAGEDNFSKLEDEIYKTVTFLYQTKETAVHTKNAFAENLANIAHQIKTPITTISFIAQTMQREYGEQTSVEKLTQMQTSAQTQKLRQIQKLAQIQKQLLRLTRLEEALLLLSRLDAGSLCFQKKKIDVFTVLVLAADNLQELFAESGTSIDIPELGEMAITADLDWTMEAVMNLMKNCMEHNPGGKIHCFYGQNPLYTEIRIWDEGEGFYKEELPHLFERFYRGKNACGGGIGIGLSLSKEIIERQNGTIRAQNMADAGACFEIRFYSH